MLRAASIWIAVGIVLAATIVPAADRPAADNAVKELPATLELFAGDQAYRRAQGEEQKLHGVLSFTAKNAQPDKVGQIEYLRVEMADTVTLVRVAGRAQEVLPYVGQRVEVVGKPWKESTPKRPVLWPARLRVLASKAEQPFTEAVPSVSEELEEIDDEVLDDLVVPSVGDEEQAGKATKQFDVLGRAPHAGRSEGEITTTPKGTVIRSQKELIKFVGPDIAKSLPELMNLDGEINFDRMMLLHVYGGQRSTGGWQVEIGPHELSKDTSTLTVHWTMHKPDGFATQVISYPGELVLTKRFNGKIRFVPRTERSSTRNSDQ